MLRRTVFRQCAGLVSVKTVTMFPELLHTKSQTPQKQHRKKHDFMILLRRAREFSNRSLSEFGILYQISEMKQEGAAVRGLLLCHYVSAGAF